MRKQTYYVKGMHCPSCEVLIEKRLLEIKGIKFADASVANNKVDIGYEEEKPPIGKLNNIFRENNYTFSDESFVKEGSSLNSFIESLTIAFIAIVAFYTFSKLGLLSFVNITSNSSLPTFFIFGLLAGLSSCAALIGGLILSLSKQWLNNYSENSTFFDKTKPHLLFNFGRLISFAILGGILGILGEKFQISPAITSILIIIVSALMLILAFQMLGIKAFNKFRIALPKSITSKVITDERKDSRFAPFIFGLLTFLLPCGFTIVAEGAAILSANPIRGSMIMFLFSLGTTIPLLVIGLSSVKFLSNQNLSDKFLKVAGILIIFFVFYNLNVQFGLTRVISSIKPATAVNGSAPSNNTNVQVIKATYTTGNDISPKEFTVKANQPVRFEVEVKDNGSGCMSTIMIPGLWSQPILLQKGTPIVMEFTPTNTGSYQITCAMGVPRGSITVVN